MDETAPDHGPSTEESVVVSVDPALLRAAKARCGLSGDAETVARALVLLAGEDGFAETFRKLRGTVDPSVDFGI